VCAYWQKVSEVLDRIGGRKYESLSDMVKAFLMLLHSNERGFCVNNAILGKEKLLLAENTIVPQHVVMYRIKQQDVGLMLFDSKHHQSGTTTPSHCRMSP